MAITTGMREGELLGLGWGDVDLTTRSIRVRRDLYPLLAAAGLPRVRFHDLRHTLATLLLSRGVHPKVVSEMLGHTDVGITLDLYSHVTVTMQHDAARNLDELFGGQLGGQAGSVADEAAGQPS